MTNSSSVKSPCIGVCAIDPKTALCTGCMRTLDEIACWPVMDDAERQRILCELPARENAAFARAKPLG